MVGRSHPAPGGRSKACPPAISRCPDRRSRGLPGPGRLANQAWYTPPAAGNPVRSAAVSPIAAITALTWANSTFTRSLPWTSTRPGGLPRSSRVRPSTSPYLPQAVGDCVTFQDSDSSTSEATANSAAPTAGRWCTPPPRPRQARSRRPGCSPRRSALHRRVFYSIVHYTPIAEKDQRPMLAPS